MNEYYKHGKVNCEDCFNTKFSGSKNGWQLINNPYYWGSSTPEILVLGFSKGATQMKEEHFEEIAFKGMRNRLREMLILLEVINKDTKSIDNLFSKTQSKFGFASLIRCGIVKDGKTSGSLINKTFREDIPKSILDHCTSKFLKENLPSSIQRIIILGSGKEFKLRCQKHFNQLFNDKFESIDENNFKINEILCTFIAHPSPANGYYVKWVKNFKKYKS